MRATTAILFTLAAAAYMTGCSATSSIIWDEKVTETRSITADHVAGGSLYIDTRNGSVEVYADDSVDAVKIDATVTAADTSEVEAAKRLAETKVIVERDTGQRLTIRPDWPSIARAGEGASFNVRMPDANGVIIDTSNGNVTVHGLRGKLVIDTSNSGVEVVNHDGETIIDTSNGAVDVRGNRGRVYADSSNGRIRITDQHGSVEADTSNGPIEVVLANDQSGPLKLDTSNGSITVTVGPAFAGTVEFDTSNGSIYVRNRGGDVRTSTIGKSDGVIVMAKDGHKSIVETSNASITFTIEGEATASAED